MEKSDELRIRVKQIANGKFLYSHYVALFFWIRQHHPNLDTVREVADFIAHPRKKIGETTRRIVDIYNFLWYRIGSDMDRENLPENFPEILRIRLRTKGAALLKEETGIDYQIAEKLLKSITNSFRLDHSSGKYSIPPLFGDDYLLVQSLLDRATFNAFSGAELHLEFREGLIRSDLLDGGDDEALADAYESVVIFALVQFHLGSVMSSDGYGAQLSLGVNGGGFVGIDANFLMGAQNGRVYSTRIRIFETELKAETYMAASLIPKDRLVQAPVAYDPTPLLVEL